jgi:ubiquinone/menaquinone biosynthesis C-methylase UbiE
VISAQLETILRCPQCHGTLVSSRGRDDQPQMQTWTLVCTKCGERYEQHSRDFVDLRPAMAFAEQTKYLDEALHADARHETVSPPLLQAGIRQRQLRRFLRLRPGDLVIDLGCGSGRSLLWNAASGAQFVGADVSPFFAREARARMDLALADLRRLPFADGTFSKAYALDVLEHLSPEALDAMLTEAARVLQPGGALFVYSHVRKNAPIAAGLRGINALARWLERRGLIDMTQERLRKSDHLNPLTDIPHLERVVAATGFRIARIRYYTPLVGGFIENILMRMTERALSRRAAKRMSKTGAAAAAGTPTATAAPTADDTAAVREARTSAKARIARGGPLSWALHALTALMEIDMLLFGRIRSGPFFALLVKHARTPLPDPLPVPGERELRDSGQRSADGQQQLSPTNPTFVPRPRTRMAAEGQLTPSKE